MNSLKNVAEQYIEKYEISTIFAVRVLLFIIAVIVLLTVRGKARQISLFTCIMALFVTFIPEMISLVKTLNEYRTRYI